MDAADRDSLSEPLGGHPLEKVTSPPSSCISDVIVERCSSTSSASPPSSPYASSKLGSCSRGAVTTRVTGRHFVSSSAEKSCSDFPAAGWAVRGAQQDAALGSLAPSGTGDACASTSETGRAGRFGKPAAVSMPYSLRAGDVHASVAASGGSSSSSRLESQPMPLKVGPAAAHYTDTAMTNASRTAEANHFHVGGAAARPAARVIRVHRLSHQQQQHQRGERTSERSAHRRVSAVAERENDAELQQIARQEQETSDDDAGFTMGEIIERSTDSQQQQQQSSQSQELCSQQKVQQQQARPPLQQMLHSPERVFGGLISQRAQNDAARINHAAAAPTNVAAPAAASDSEENISERKISFQLSRIQQSVFRKPHAAVEAPLGFPQPVHRSVLQQLLRSCEGERLSQGHRYTWEEQQQQQQTRGEDHEAQELQQPSGLRVEERLAGEGTLTTACVLDSDVERHATDMRSWRPSTADYDRARIEEEAAALLRAMQPCEIAAARQELLDRFGPRRFAALQRRALRRATSQQQNQLTQRHDDVHPQRAGAAETADQKSPSRETASGRPVVDGQQLAVPSGFSGLSSSSHSAKSRPVSSGSRGDPSSILAASPAALVSFAAGYGSNTVTKGASAACWSTAASGKLLSCDGGSATAAATSTRTAAVLPEAGSMVRFDLHEIAKLRWTDPLGPEDWQQGPVGYAADTVGTELPGASGWLLQQQQSRGSRGACCGVAAAAEVSDVLPATVAFSSVYVKLERLRFDFDGCLRSDLFHAQEAVGAVVSGARAAAMRPRCLQRVMLTQQSKPHSQQLTERGPPNARVHRNQPEGEDVFFLPNGVEQGAENKRRNEVDIQTESVESTVVNMLQVASENFVEATSDESDPLEFHRGLHHHGDAAALPGYTLPELLHLAQSSNQAQSALALQTLAAIIRTGGTLFTCPSIEEAAAFSASLRRWAEQQRSSGPSTQEELHREPRQCETHLGERALQQQQNTQEQSRRDRQSRLVHHHRQAYMTPRQRARDDSSCCESAAGAAADCVDRPLTSNGDKSLLSDVHFETKAGYGVGFRRWHNYITRDLHLAWRLHALLHVQAAAVHRAALSCLAALFGPPALSGMRQVRAATEASVVSVMATHGRGAHSAFKGKGSSTSNSTGSRQRQRLRDSGRLDGPDSRLNNSRNNSKRGVSGDARRCDRQPAVNRRHEEVLLPEQIMLEDLSTDENLSEEAGRVATLAFSERNISGASAQKDGACWGPGWASLPFHMKKLPRQLIRQVFGYHYFDQGRQQQKETSDEVHCRQKARQQRKARPQQTWPYGDRAAEPHRQRRQKGIEHREEIEYVCTWSLGGLDFVSEGLLVLDCCSGLRRIDSGCRTHLFYAEALGEDSSAGCRGVFAFWHAFFGRVIADAAARAADSHQSLQQAGSSLLSADVQPWIDKQKAGEEETQQSAESAPAPLAAEKLNLKERAAAGRSEVAASEARSSSVGKSVIPAGNDSRATSTMDEDVEKERATATNTVPSGGVVEEALKSRKFADVSEEAESTTAFLYDSVGALFSSSPVEALLGCGNLLPRLTLLLSIYRTDVDVERSAIQLLVGLSAGGPASVTYMLSHAPLQERIRSLAEGLLVGSAARSERMQRQRRHENLAVATSRAAGDASSGTAAGVYFVARAELDRQTDHSTKNSQWSSVMRGSRNRRSTSNSGLSRSHNDDDCSSESYRTRQEKVEFACDKANGESYLLQRSEYFLLRELLVLLRLWAGWAPRNVTNSAEVDAAAAVAAWRDTLVGHESACCALLLQTFTSGLSLLQAPAATKETLPSTCRPRDVTWSEVAADAATAAAPQTTDGDQSRSPLRGRHEDMRSSEPGDEEVLVAAVEAARVLRMLEGRGMLRNIFASFYPSAVHVLHAFTRRLEKMQEEFLCTRGQDESCSRPQRPACLAVTTQQDEQYEQNGSLCELEVEMKQQMQELQQHDLDLQKHGCRDNAPETPEFLRKLREAALDFTGHCQTGVGVGDGALTHGTEGEDETDAKLNSNGLENICENFQRGVSVVWIYQGAIIRELLRWGAVATMKEEVSQDATAEAYDFLVQVAPLLRAVPSLLTCWIQLEYHSKVVNASFPNAAAVQVLQAAMKLLLETSRKLARAVCPCIFCMSQCINRDSKHDRLATENLPTNSHRSTSCSRSSHFSDGETSNKDSSTAETLSFRRSRRASGGDASAVQQVAMKCWMSLVEPLVETLIGSAEERTITAGCSHVDSVTSIASSSANRTCRSDVATVSGRVAAVGCCAEQEVNAESTPAGHGYGCAREKGKLKTCGALLHAMNKMRDTCSHKGGSNIAKALSSYAIETGWTCLTRCCCSQCLPCLPKNNMRNSCAETNTTGKPIRPLRCSRWCGLVPATSESFAGTDLETRFAALSAVHKCCSISAPRRCGSQDDDVHPASATLKGSPDLPYCGNSGSPASCGATADATERFLKGNTSDYAANITGVGLSNSCDTISDDKDTYMGGTKCSKNNVAAGALGLCVTSWLPQDVEFFLSEASFLSTACNWIASSLHVLHHWGASRGTCDAGAGVTPETESSSSSPSGHDWAENKSRQCCTVQDPSTRRRSVKQPVGECDGSGRNRSLRSRKPVICASDITDGNHCNIFPSNRLENLAMAAAGLASALCGALQYLFRELRWPRQLPSSYPSASRPTAEVTGSSVSKILPPPETSWKQQQRHQCHETQRQQQRNPAVRRQYDPENCIQHQPTATSGPLLLFEPLAQLMLSLQLLLRACDPSLKMWTASDEQRCLLAACSAAATPRTFLRALLLLYHSVTASSLPETKRHRSPQPGEQKENGSHSPLEPTFWLRGAAQWYTMCCSVFSPGRRRNASATADSAGEVIVNETSVYEVLVEAAAAAQGGVPLKQHSQQTDASEGVAWPWVLCAAESLEVFVYNAEMQQQERLARRGEKNEPAYSGKAAQRTQEIFFSEQLAVCPIDVVVGGGIWQCFCCDTALVVDHDVKGRNSEGQSKRLSEALSLCHLVLSTPNLARELSHYVPPGAIFAALVSLYTEPHLAGGTGSTGSSSSLVRPQDAATGVDMAGRSAFSIYARPGVYDIFCKMLDKLLLQPLGKHLRHHALGLQPENQHQSQNQEDKVVWGTQRHLENQMHKKECERRLMCEKEEQRQSQIENDQRQEEICPQEKHQKVDGRLQTAPLFSCTQVPSGGFYFSSAFLAVFTRACQLESTVLLEPLSNTALNALPASFLLPQHCLHWFPVCCNKAHDVLVERAARLLLVSQNAAEAADPLLSLLLWLLSSPAFPLECRSMLVRGDQTWLKVASQLFCFVYSVGVFSSPCAHQQLNHLQPNRPLRDPKQGEQVQHATQLACHPHEEPIEEVNPQRQPEGLQSRNAENYLPELGLPVADASEVSATASPLEPLRYWGMQSPRGDVFWFTAPDSLYVVLPGMWREESEDILIGWSSYVKDRLREGFLLKKWHLTCRGEQETACCAPQDRKGTPRAASYVAALFPLHTLALLVADDINDLVTLLPPTPLVGNATEATRDQNRRQQGHGTDRQKQVLQDECCSISEEKQPQYTYERRGFTVSPVAQLNCTVSSSQAGQQQDPLRSPELPCAPWQEGGNLRQSLSERRVKDIDRRFSKLKRLLGGHTAPERFIESEARVAEVADHIARIIYVQAGGRTVGGT